MPNSRSRANRRVALVVAALVSFAFMRPVTATAHSGNAVFETLEAAGGSDLVIDLRVRVRYSEDQEPAERAFLKATPRSPDGRELPPVDLERAAGGVYQGRITVDAPGTWTLTIASAFPPGSTAVTVDVGDETSNWRWFAVGGGAAALAVVGGAVVARRRRN